ncbi:MAG TPA: metalloregulator ArsR/SmtB family transcription factor [Flavisolibacter sp.]|nr:metalloregulator ArsR/SmtB family transcription factor [Flavisolibacter sp.]
MNTFPPTVLADNELYQIKKASVIFRAINNPLRQQILQLLHKHRQLRVTELFIKLRMEQPVISQHLGILRQAFLVKTVRQGKFIFYSLNYERLQQIEELAEKLVAKQ